MLRLIQHICSYIRDILQDSAIALIKLRHSAKQRTTSIPQTEYQLAKTNAIGDIRKAVKILRSQLEKLERDNIKKHGFITSYTPSISNNQQSVIKNEIKALERFIHF